MDSHNPHAELSKPRTPRFVSVAFAKMSIGFGIETLDEWYRTDVRFYRVQNSIQRDGIVSRDADTPGRYKRRRRDMHYVICPFKVSVCASVKRPFAFAAERESFRACGKSCVRARVLGLVWFGCDLYMAALSRGFQHIWWLCGYCMDTLYSSSFDLLRFASQSPANRPERRCTATQSLTHPLIRVICFLLMLRRTFPTQHDMRL